MVRAAEVEAVEARVKAWASSLSKNDPEVMGAFYEDSEELDMVDSGGRWHHGLDEVKESYRESQREWTCSDSVPLRLEVRVFGDVAVAAFEHRYKARMSGNGVNLQIHKQTTMTLRKVDGQWKIVSEHSSPIEGIPMAIQIKR
ncbi:L-asparaginase [Haloferula helveola]|uniref:L-asparaginase n=2 Tax=Haloferula helveola TaxID=490095 RepID=A0ABM7R8S9_9BACT|nr:L-asparaginase [Haloferula helveola]